MVASRQIDIPFYMAIGQQSGRGFRALAQVFGGTAISVLCENIVPVAKGVGVNLLEFAATEIVEVVSARNVFKTAAKSAKRQILRTNWLLVARKRQQTELFQQNLQ